MTYHGSNSYQTTFGASFTILAKMAIIAFSVILVIGMAADNSTKTFVQYESILDMSQQMDEIAAFENSGESVNTQFEIAFGMFD